MSSFGLIEENIELSHIHFAVIFIEFDKKIVVSWRPTPPLKNCLQDWLIMKAGLAQVESHDNTFKAFGSCKNDK